MTNHLDPDHICETCRPLRAVNNTITGPMLGRRNFFKLAGTGVSGFFLAPMLNTEVKAAPALDPQLIGKARNCVLIFLSGGPSHTDTFDLKVGSWTPADFDPTTYNGVLFPQGLMPKLAAQIDKLAIMRSVRAPALVHSLQQKWVQIARNPTSLIGKIAPHIGSVVALEFETQRKPHQRLPSFIALNGKPSGPGYFNGSLGSFNVNPSSGGLGSLVHPDGQTKFNARYEMLKSLDGNLRGDSPLGNEVSTMSQFYNQSKGMMYDPAVDAIFKYTTTESQNFGNNSFGNACIVTRNLLKADLGTRFVQITLGGWDNHASIYSTTGGIYPSARALDNGLGRLLTEFSQTPGVVANTLLDETLIVVIGEFGRTVGAITGQGGRDHHFQQFAVFAGGGTVGGRAIGTTDATGKATAEPGWSQNRNIYNEDIAATIYAALGINYLTVRHDDPFGRGFEYVPFANDGAWQPVTELFDRKASATPRSVSGARLQSGRSLQ